MTSKDIPPSIETMRRGLALIKSVGGTEEELKTFRGLCRDRVSLARIFEEKVEGDKVGEGNGNGEVADKGVKADV